MLGDTIRMLRCERNLSPQTVAEGVGVSVMAIEYYEANNWRPGTQVIAELAKFFGITVEEIVNGYSILHDETTQDTLIARNMGNNNVRVISRTKISV